MLTKECHIKNQNFILIVKILLNLSVNERKYESSSVLNLTTGIGPHCHPHQMITSGDQDLVPYGGSNMRDQAASIKCTRDSEIKHSQ